MKTYLKNLLEEKRIDLETRIEVEGPSGTNSMPLQMIVDAINGTSQGEKAQIRKTLVTIDFKNGDVMHYFRHLAHALSGAAGQATSTSVGLFDNLQAAEDRLNEEALSYAMDQEGAYLNNCVKIAEGRSLAHATVTVPRREVLIFEIIPLEAHIGIMG